MFHQECMNAYHREIIGRDTTPGMLSDYWKRRHHLALQSTDPHVMALLPMIKGLAEYADAHRQRYDSPIGESGVLREAWAAIAQGLIELLNGETGALDCGTVDHTIREIARAAGVTLE